MLNRRSFLSHSCALGTALPTLGSTLLGMGAMREAAAQTAVGYKAMVCILLAGGNDSYNMLTPSDTAQYNAYAGIRADLALPRDTLLDLNVPVSDGRTFALHPGMSGLAQLVNSGDAAMLANVGTLLEPFDAVAVENGNARLPVGLFSHADQINQWQTAIADNRTAQGWAGRIADRMQTANVANGVSMNISLSGSNVFQSGDTSTEYSILPTGNGAVGINTYDEASAFGTNRRETLDALLATPHQSLLRSEYQRRFRAAIDSQRVLSDALATAPELATTFSDTPLSAAVRQIARVISVRDALGVTRQTFFITVGGWDHHDEVLQNQAGMLPALSTGLVEFRNALTELGVFDDVLTFTISDFGRTLTSNGRGSDHGWGGHHIVMGGAVSGADIYGQYPLLANNSPLDLGRGVYAPTTPTDSYFAEIALWFGVDPSELDQILPNIGRFYSPGATEPPIGFLS